jgi:hypothetical protein
MNLISTGDTAEQCFDITDFSTNHTFCGDCWRSKSTNSVCAGFFWIYSVIWLVILVLMIEFFIAKSATRAKTRSRASNSFTKILAFVVIWSASLTFYFTESYVNYGFRTQIWITSVPIFFTFLIVVVVIQNLL